MKLSTRSRYGARMVLDIARYGGNGPVRIRDISSRRGLSEKYLDKLLRDLKKSGIVKSKRGPGGGNMLARPPELITIGEVVRILEGNIDLSACVDAPGSCARSAACPTRRIWSAATRAFHAVLDSYTVADLMNDPAADEMLQRNCP